MASKTPIEPRHGPEGGGPRLSGSGEREHRQVHPVQETRSCHHFGAAAPDTGGTEGILEGPYGVGVLRGPSTVIGACPGAKLRFHVDSVDGVPFQWSEWRIKYVLLTHVMTMLYLHGATLQQIFSPFILLRALKRPDCHPVPGVDDVVLARCPPEVLQFPLPKLFSILSSRIGA